jgi:hypothetical protein
MPEVQDFDNLTFFVSLIVDPNRTVEQFPHARRVTEWCSEIRERSQEVNVIEVNVIEESISKPSCRLGTTSPDVIEDLLKIH